MSFHLAFAPHLGFPTIATPLFADLLETIDPIEHVALAARIGFCGVQDPFAAARSDDDQARIGRALVDHGLRAGCFVYTTMARLFVQPWGSGDPTIEATIQADVLAAFEAGRRLGSRQIAILSVALPAVPHKVQTDRMTALLQRLAPVAEAAGVMLCLEAVDASRLPMMLLHHLADAASIVRAVDHPSVRLIFDAAHVAAMDGPPLALLDDVWDLVAVLQMADHPGRTEMGSGEIDFEALLAAVDRRRFAGLIELEHGWSEKGAAVQHAYLDRLGRWDERVVMSEVGKG